MKNVSFSLLNNFFSSCEFYCIADLSLYLPCCYCKPTFIEVSGGLPWTHHHEYLYFQTSLSQVYFVVFLYVITKTHLQKIVDMNQFIVGKTWNEFEINEKAWVYCICYIFIKWLKCALTFFKQSKLEFLQAKNEYSQGFIYVILSKLRQIWTLCDFTDLIAIFNINCNIYLWFSFKIIIFLPFIKQALFFISLVEY